MSYLFSLGVFAAIWAILVLSLNILLGYGGQISLGHAAFFGIGAYTTAVVTTHYGWPFAAAIMLSIIVTGAVGGFLGLPSLRVRNDFLVLVTIGINFIFVAIVQYVDFFGGALGIVGIPPPTLFGLPLQGWRYLLLCLIFLALVAAMSLRLPNTWGGLGLLGLRDDEEAAAAVGISHVRYKISAFVISGAVAGLGGALYAPFVGNVSSGRFGFTASVTLLSMLIFGGVGTVWGAIFGGAVLKVLPEFLRGFSELRFAFYGIILLLSILFMPGGVLGQDSFLVRTSRDLASRLRKPRSGTKAARDIPKVAASHELRVTGVTVDFGGLRALDNVSLKVSSGEILGLIGPNGAGKTTLFNVIAGTVKATSGHVILDGEEISGLASPQRAHKGVARTFQTVRPFSTMDIRHNILAGLGVQHYPRVRAFLQPLPASSSTDAIVHAVGLDQVGNVTSDALPVGSLRKLEVGRAVATGAPIVLLDEPAAGLAHVEVEELAGAVRRIADAGRAVILVEHNMQFAMSLCQRIVVLAAGKVIAEGPPEDVARHPDVIRVYLGERAR